MEKPTTLRIEDFKKDIINTINNSNLPLFLLDYILKDLYNEIHLASQNQLSKDIREYTKSLKEASVE